MLNKNLRIRIELIYKYSLSYKACIMSEAVVLGGGQLYTADRGPKTSRHLKYKKKLAIL
jgi:hypothetical protein